MRRPGTVSGKSLRLNFVNNKNSTFDVLHTSVIYIYGNPIFETTARLGTTKVACASFLDGRAQRKGNLCFLFPRNLTRAANPRRRSI